MKVNRPSWFPAEGKAANEAKTVLYNHVIDLEICHVLRLSPSVLRLPWKTLPDIIGRDATQDLARILKGRAK